MDQLFQDPNQKPSFFSVKNIVMILLLVAVIGGVIYYLTIGGGGTFKGSVVTRPDECQTTETKLEHQKDLFDANPTQEILDAFKTLFRSAPEGCDVTTYGDEIPSMQAQLQVKPEVSKDAESKKIALQCKNLNTRFEADLNSSSLIAAKKLYDIKGDCTLDKKSQYLAAVDDACGNANDILYNATKKTAEIKSQYKIFIELKCSNSNGVIDIYQNLPESVPASTTETQPDHFKQPLKTDETPAATSGGDTTDTSTDAPSGDTATVTDTTTDDTSSGGGVVVGGVNTGTNITAYCNQKMDTFAGLIDIANENPTGVNADNASNLYNDINNNCPKMPKDLKSAYMSLLQQYGSGQDAVGGTPITGADAIGGSGFDDTNDDLLGLGELPSYQESGAQLPAWGSEGEWDTAAKQSGSDQTAQKTGTGTNAQKSGAMLKNLGASTLTQTKGSASSVKRSTATGPEALIYLLFAAASGAASYGAARFAKRKKK